MVIAATDSSRSVRLLVENQKRKRSSVLSWRDVLDANTGEFMPPRVYRKNRLAAERLRQQTQDLADRLEAHGVRSRLDTNIVEITDVTRQVRALESFRNICLLPSVAQRNRREQLSDIAYYLEKRDDSDYWRYAVVTFGDRIAAGGELRESIQAFNRSISKWAHQVRKKFDVEVGFRGLEFPRGNDASYHLHANILFRTPYMADKGDAFRAFTRKWFGTWWRDNGRIDNIRELVKYPFKPNDIEGIEDDELVWLFRETFKQKITQLLGPIADFRRERKEARQRVVYICGKPCLRQIEDVLPGERDDREPSTSEPVNIILARVPPSFRTMWAEAATLVMNYQPNPIGEKARERLLELDVYHDESRRIWDEKGAPDPRTALAMSEAAMAQEDTNVRALWRSPYMVHNDTISVQRDGGEAGGVVSSSLLEDDFGPPDDWKWSSDDPLIENYTSENTTLRTARRGGFLDIFE